MKTDRNNDNTKNKILSFLLFRKKNIRIQALNNALKIHNIKFHLIHLTSSLKFFVLFLQILILFVSLTLCERNRIVSQITINEMMMNCWICVAYWLCFGALFYPFSGRYVHHILFLFKAHFISNMIGLIARNQSGSKKNEC